MKTVSPQMYVLYLQSNWLFSCLVTVMTRYCSALAKSRELSNGKRIVERRVAEVPVPLSPLLTYKRKCDTLITAILFFSLLDNISQFNFKRMCRRCKVQERPSNDTMFWATIMKSASHRKWRQIFC